MLKRTKEQLQQIHADLLLCMESINYLSSLGWCYPQPLNGKSWKEEKAEFFEKIIDADFELLRKVKSCEVRTAIEKTIDMWERKWDFANDHPYTDLIFGVRKVENTYVGDMLMIDLEESLRLAVEGTLDSERYEELEKTLDEIGTSACEIRAFDQVELEQGDQLAHRVCTSVRESSKTI